ncbi:Spy0128 family protein [Lacrimispora sp.]|uniref:Spy0128 family protein n=1 Tax=Lacrimispora sp. TaxID=2719234 RepID=UPI0028AD9D48|nr:FctA domain-containing protein [Lacrimispora sp.]
MSSKNKVNPKGIAVWYLLILSLMAIAFPLDTHAGTDSVSVTLYVDQVFVKNSSASDVNNEFLYDLISLDPGNPMPSGSLSSVHSFTAAGTSEKEVGPITFSNTGIYRYEIKGNASSPASGYSYDTQVYSVEVYVKRITEELSAEIIVKKSDGSKAGSIKFENTYTPLASNPEIMVDPPVKKTVSGNPSKTSSFTFSLTARDGANPMPEGSVNGVKYITIYGSGEEDFGTWSYIREGTYYYTISEVVLRDTGYTYDDSVYTITDVVKDTDGQLVVTRTVTNGSNKQVESCTFINKYNGGGGSSGSGGSGGSGGKGSGGSSSGGPGVKIDENSDDSLQFVNGDTPLANLLENESNAGSGAYSPKTGDDIRYELYAAMLCTAAAVAAGCVIYLILAANRIKKNQRKDDNGEIITGET